MMEDNHRPRFRFRLKTILLVVAILALVSVVVVQQLQIARMKQLIEAGEKQKDQLTVIIRELRGYLERHK